MKAEPAKEKPKTPAKAAIKAPENGDVQQSLDVDKIMAKAIAEAKPEKGGKEDPTGRRTKIIASQGKHYGQIMNLAYY